MEGMTTLEAVAERVARGETLNAGDARAVLDSYDLITIGMMGDEVRRRMRGLRTTFVRVFEIHTDAPPGMLPPDVTAGEFRIVGRPASVDAAVAAVRAVRRLAGSVPVTAYALRDLIALAPDAAALRGLFSGLQAAGLDAVAELSVDDPSDSDGAVRLARQAGIAVVRLTVGTVSSSVDSPEPSLSADARVAAIERAHALQETLGGFRAFAPLPRTTSAAAPTTGYDDVKQIALARLMVSNIDSIQVDWALYGPKLAQVGLTVGADDIDSVAAVDPGTLGPRRLVLEEVRRNIRAAALEPLERDGLFRGTERPDPPAPPLSAA
jgi:aminodeoxyfutalosine synthase